MEDKEVRVFIKAPEGFTFRECSLCKNPYVHDPILNLYCCLWCELHKEEYEPLGEF